MEDGVGQLATETRICTNAQGAKGQTKPMNSFWVYPWEGIMQNLL
jgi:hypothetical protein